MKEFKEEQGFRIRWAWAGLVALNLLFLYAIVQQVILGKPFGEKPAPDFVLVLAEMLMLALLLLLFSMRLYTRINETGIYYRFRPFHRKERHIAWNEITAVYMREYNSFYEYGGWGIRVGAPQTGNAVNTSQSGNTGLQLKFHDKKPLLIGTARPVEMKEFLEQLISEGKTGRN